MVPAWVGSSILPGGLKVQWHTLSRWFANVEIDVRLLMPCGVLLSPQYQQERRKLGKDNLRPVDFRVTSRTESNHQMQNRLAWFTIYRRIHRVLRPALASHRNIRHPAVSGYSRSR
jgi:hypothetical protein